MKMTLLKNRFALVTGGTSGIGLGIARALAGAGARVAINSFRKEADTDQVLEELSAASGQAALFIEGDLSKAAPVTAMIQSAEQAFGRLDSLVNNAGIQHVAPIQSFPDDKWDAIIAINMSAVFHATKAVLPGMIERKFGRIINISSAHGLVASPFKSAYVAAKHGVVGFTKVTALEVAELGITANAICPGYVWTPLVAAQIPDQAKTHGMSEDEVVKKVLLANQPNKRFATVEEMGGLAVFLASDLGASMTGTALPVDGGWVAH